MLEWRNNHTLVYLFGRTIFVYIFVYVLLPNISLGQQDMEAIGWIQPGCKSSRQSSAFLPPVHVHRKLHCHYFRSEACPRPGAARG